MPRTRSSHEHIEHLKLRNRDFEKSWIKLKKDDDYLNQMYHSQDEIRIKLYGNPEYYTEVNTPGSPFLKQSDAQDAKLSNYNINCRATNRFKKLYDEGKFICPKSWLEPIVPCENCGKPLIQGRTKFCCAECNNEYYDRMRP